ncbi:MAG TPA: hypothetical protein VGF37_09735 [Chthoniobacterales bacterium]
MSEVAFYFLLTPSTDVVSFIILCRWFLDSSALTLKKSNCPVPECFSIGHASCFQTASVEEVPYELAKKVVKSCFVSGIRSPAFGLFNLR